jgi:hypothetical protein
MTDGVFCAVQGCQMVFFQTKNPTLGKFFVGLAMEDVGIFMAVWYTLRPFGIFLVI